MITKKTDSLGLVVKPKRKPTLKKLVENIDYYIDENNNYVFTAKYHLDRGHCCNNKCKHCPYEEKQ